MFPKKGTERDASFFQYKLMQIIGLLILSLIVYCIYVFFDLGRFEDKEKIMKPLSKDELRPQNMFKKYLKPENPQ
jgi:hypothetical protein